MIKTASMLLAIAGAAITVPVFAQAANTSSATANGSTTIVQPLTVTKNADLVFGRIVKPRSGGTGTVTLANNSNSVVAASGAVALSGITTSHAAFTVDGEGGQVVTVTAPTSFDLLKGSDKITVTLDPDFGSTVTLSNALGANGSKVLNLGGNFSLPDTQATGAYTGSFTVSVAYQ